MNSSTHKNASRNVIPNQRVVVIPSPVQIAPPRQSAAENASDVRIQREGDLVRTIEVVCACGEHIRLICDYSPEIPSPTQTAASPFERQTGDNENQGTKRP